MVSRYPNTCTLYYMQAGTVNTVGVITPGTTVSTTFYCNVQPENFQFVQGANGESIKVKYTIFAPLLNTIFPADADLKLSFEGIEYKVLKAFQYQKHSELQV